MTRAAKVILTLRVAEAAVAVAKTVTSYSFLRSTAPVSEQVDSEARVYVLVPLLREQERVSALLERWQAILAAEPALTLVLLTTAREQQESPTGAHETMQSLAADGRLRALIESDRAIHLHYPAFNRTYGEQVSWGVRELRESARAEDYLLLTNADSRIERGGIGELLQAVGERRPCAQQSALFLANLAEVGAIPAAEALLQSSWTLETELFRYLAGSGAVRWLPPRLADAWYQHTVGHGLLISMGLLDSLGGFPSPAAGLEDSALGYMIRARSAHVHPLRRLELADAPPSVRALLRQRATWVRGPLGAIGYHPSTARERMLVAQSLYDGVRWALSVPAICAEILILGGRERRLWGVVFTVRRYTTLMLMLASLPDFRDYGLEPPPARRIALAAALYPAAVLSYGLGGLRGAIEMVSEWVSGQPRTQPRTEG